MDVLLLWLCFLAVLGGIALAGFVIVRDGRLYVAARRAGASRLEAVAQVPAARRVERPAVTVPRQRGRGIGQLMPLVEQEVPETRPRLVPDLPRGRGLGQLLPDLQSAEGAAGRGLGRVTDRSA